MTERAPLNGVDTPTLFATLDAVKAQPEIAKFQFRATNQWVKGTHNRSSMRGFYGAGQELEHKHETVIEADHPAVLVGADNGPTPVEYVLAALAACLTSGLANIAAARGIELTEVESTVEGDIDLLGILGLSNEVRNGYSQIRVNVTIGGGIFSSSARMTSTMRRSASVGQARRHRRPRAVGWRQRPRRD